MLPFILIFCFTSVAHAQIQNTQWKGTLIMDSTVDIVWYFDKDTSRQDRADAISSEPYVKIK